MSVTIDGVHYAPARGSSGKLVIALSTHNKEKILKNHA